MIKSFKELLEIPEAKWVFWGAVLLTLVVVAIFVAKKFRDMAIGGGLGSSELLPDADQLRSSGMLNEDEYKKVKMTIAEQQKANVKNEGNEKSEPN